MFTLVNTYKNDPLTGNGYQNFTNGLLEVKNTVLCENYKKTRRLR